MSHLVEYIAYLKREIHSLRAQLAEALEQKGLYEPLLKTEPPRTPPPMPPPPKSYWNWFTDHFSFPASPTSETHLN